MHSTTSSTVPTLLVTTLVALGRSYGTAAAFFAPGDDDDEEEEEEEESGVAFALGLPPKNESIRRFLAARPRVNEIQPAPRPAVYPLHSIATLPSASGGGRAARRDSLSFSYSCRSSPSSSFLSVKGRGLGGMG